MLLTPSNMGEFKLDKLLIKETTIFILFLVGFLFWLFFFFGPHPWHMEVPRLWINSEL